MKVKISFTLDVDAESWTANYGITGAKAIREDVRVYVENGAVEHLRDLGLLKEDA